GAAHVDPQIKLTSHYYSRLLELSDPDTQTEIMRRIDAAFERLRRVSRNDQEIFDRFYAYQRAGQKNQKLARDPWQANRISPFYSRRAMAAAAGRLDTRSLIREVFIDPISAFLPASVNIPFNGEVPPALYARGAFNSAAFDAITLGHKIKRRIRRMFGRGEKDLQEVRTTIGKSLLRPVLETRTGELLACPARRDGGAYDIDAAFDLHGRNVWMHLVALRFLRICRDLADRGEGPGGR
ncbi:MAG: hypothetical protein AAF317_04920, partial [Pseudomonadota bacterium]